MPAGHPYVTALDLGGAGVEVPVDPDPDDPSSPARGRWWPPPALDPTWLAARHAVEPLSALHVHFGFDDRSPAQLRALVRTLRTLRIPLVLTVHDLRSPHQEDPAVLDAQLEVLVPAAAAVLTLTPWAAEQVERRWHRRAVVAPHPALVPAATATRLRAERTAPGPGRRPVVGVACKSLRTNTDPLRLLPTLREVCRDHGATLRVSVHTDVVTSPRSPRHRALVRWLADADDVETVVHDPLSDADLWRTLAAQDVAVLPYAFGTHSGWLEVCHDVGTFVAAPTFGGYRSQGADAGFDPSATGSELRAGLDAAVGGLLARAAAGELAGGEPATRQRRAAEARAAYLEVYRGSGVVA